MPETPTVLLVDDEALFIMLFEDLFAEQGFDVISAYNGDMAISTLQCEEASKVNLLVTDIRLPGSLSGWDVARRAREHRPDLPVIYLSGDSLDAFETEGVTGSRIFAKPAKIDDIMQAIEDLLPRPR